MTSDAAAKVLKDSATAETRRVALYRMIWRWHFYAGLFCIPFVLVLAISGAIYLFKPQIDALIDEPYRNLALSSEAITPNRQIQLALQQVPGSSFHSYRLPEHAGHAPIVSVNRNGERSLVYINPYTGEVLKTIGFEDQFIREVRTFHGELLAGNVGSVLVELAACWAIVLIVSGLYLWWPRSAQGLAGILYPRLGRGGRLFWRDLHAVVGIWISLFALFLLITGLPWTLVWGSAFKEVRQLSAASPPAMHSHDHAAQQQTQDWTLGRAEEKAAMTEHASEMDLNGAVLDSARALNFAPPVSLSVSHDGESVWKVASDHQNRPLRATAWLDAEGNVLRRQSFADQSALDRAIGIGVAAHEGQLFGWFNQLLGLLTALGLVLMSVSGFMMWRQRKPEGVLGAPIALPDSKAGAAVTALVIGLALFLPLLAISLLVLLFLEFAVFRRLPALRQWLGLSAKPAM